MPKTNNSQMSFLCEQMKLHAQKPQKGTITQEYIDDIEDFIDGYPKINLNDKCDEYGNTLLHYAFMSGAAKLVNVLLEQGAKPSYNTISCVKPGDGYTPHQMAKIVDQTMHLYIFDNQEDVLTLRSTIQSLIKKSPDYKGLQSTVSDEMEKEFEVFTEFFRRKSMSIFLEGLRPGSENTENPGFTVKKNGHITNYEMEPMGCDSEACKIINKMRQGIVDCSWFGYDQDDEM